LAVSLLLLCEMTEAAPAFAAHRAATRGDASRCPPGLAGRTSGERKGERTMHSITSRRRGTRFLLGVATFLAALSLAGTASAKTLTEGGAGGVTPPNLARAYIAPQPYQGVESPDGYQPQLQRTADGAVDDSRSFEFADAALGFGIGVVLTGALAFALAMGRSRIRMAHS
jgi:hypothetical protein